jgi:hypothetical protein
LGSTTVYAVIRDLKKDDYASLARRMQRKESAIMIEGVAGRCLREMPNIPIYTIHDSVATTPDHVDKIKQIIREEFQKERLKPTINREDFTKMTRKTKGKRRRGKTKHKPNTITMAVSDKRKDSGASLTKPFLTASRAGESSFPAAV